MEDENKIDINDWTDAMVDLETVGTRPGDGIISIGVHLFNLGGTMGPGIKINLDIEEVMNLGFNATGSTLKFWMEQNAEAVKASFDNPVSVREGLQQLTDFLTNGKGGVNENIRVWGNGVGFDNSLLRTMYQKMNMVEPWAHWNDSCYRTIRTLCDPDKQLQPEFEGEPHNALDDAKHQTRWLHVLLEKKKGLAQAILSKATEPGTIQDQSYTTLPKNRFGVDVDYFTKNLELLIRDMSNYTPEELSRSLSRLAIVADAKTTQEPEFRLEGYEEE